MIVDPNKNSAQAGQQAFIAALVARGKRVGDIDITRPQEDAIVNHVRRDFEDGYSEGAEFRANMVEMNENWRSSTTEKDFPFEDCANIRVPFTSIQVEQMKARIMKALFGGRICELSSLDKVFTKEEIDDFNAWFTWELKNIVDIENLMRDILHYILLYGLALPIPSYEHEEQELRSFRRFDLPDPAKIEDTITEKLQAIVQEVPGDTILETSDYGVFKLEKGGEIRFCIREYDNSQELVAEVRRKETTFDGVQVVNTQLEDSIVINSHYDINKIPFYGSRMWISPLDFVKGVRDGVYRKFTNEELITICSGADVKTPDFVQMEESDLMDSEKGTDSRDISGSTPSRKWIEVYRWEGWWALDELDEGAIERYLLVPKQYVVWIAVRTRRVIKIAQLEDLNKDAKRSPIKFDFIREPNRFYSIGLAEWIRHVQAELDAIHNQRLDAGIITNVPWGFYKPLAGFNKELLQIKPGIFQPVGDPSAVNMPQSNWNPIWSFQEEQLVHSYGDLQAGQPGPAIGKPTAKRQSASEFVGTSAAIDLRTGEIVEIIRKAFENLLYRILGLYQQFGPSKRMYQIAGENGVMINKQFSMDRLQGRIYLRAAGNLQQTDDELQRQIALDMLQILMNPLLIQTGIVQGDTMFAALEKVQKSMGYEGVQLHKPDMPPTSDSPQDENRQMMAGRTPIGPTLTENFNEHLQAHMQFATDPKVQEMMSPEAMQLLAEHIRKTSQMQVLADQMRRIQAAQAMQMQKTLIQKGINPGNVGSGNPADNTGAGTQEEISGGGQAQLPGQ